ncbi:hypothetical protein ACQCVE_01405 [Metabacillus sp. 113a]|uniref:hypothetical protein n=1 Tax=Metabacillus sp. 113a TaxID=3404706 RepID=UPI003CEE81FB
MKRSEYNDEQLQELLSQLPTLKDKRSREEIYRGLARSRSARHKKIWIGPLLASFAALLILTLISPFWLEELGTTPEGNSVKENIALDLPEPDQAPAESAEERPAAQPEEESQAPAPREKMTDQTESPDTPPEEKNQTEAAKEEAVPEDDAPENDGETVTYLAEESKQEQSLVMAYSDPNVRYTIPVTLVSENGPVSAGQYGGMVTAFQEDKLGLTNYFENIEIRESESPEIIEIHMDESRELESSSEAHFAEMIKESFSGKGFEKARLFTGKKPGIEMGPLGLVEELDLKKREKKAFYKYVSKNSQPLFVYSEESYSTVSEAFQNMYRDQDETLLSIIPKGVSIESVKEKGKELILTFKPADMKNDEEFIFMLEGLLLTAKEFGFETVTFRDAKAEKIGKIEMNKPVKVPFGPNPVPVENK